MRNRATIPYTKVLTASFLCPLLSLFPPFSTCSAQLRKTYFLKILHAMAEYKRLGYSNPYFSNL